MSALTDVLERADAREATGESDVVRRASDLLRTQERIKGPRTLAEVLVRLGIRPFTLSSVQEYQRLYGRQYNQSLARQWPGIVRLASGAWPWSLGLMSVGVLGWFATETGLAALTMASGVLLFLGAASTVAFNGYWQETPLAQFDGIVPWWVADRKEAIQKLLPGATFSVVHFRADPFLLVRFGDEQAYTNVWGERFSNAE